MGAGGLKVASIVAQAPAPGLKYLGDQEASPGQELVGWVGESTDGGKPLWEASDPHLCFLCAASCSNSPSAVVKSDPQSQLIFNFLSHSQQSV